MKYAIAAAICGGLAVPSFADDRSKILSEAQLDAVFAGQSAAAGASTNGVGNFVIGNSGTAAGSNQHNSGVAGAKPTTAIASGHGYGVGFGGGTMASSGATTSSNGNIHFNMTFGGSISSGPSAYSATTSVSSGGFCVFCP